MSECEKERRKCDECSNRDTELSDGCADPIRSATNPVFFYEPCDNFKPKQPLRRDCAGCVHVIDGEKEVKQTCETQRWCQFAPLDWGPCGMFTPTPSGHWIAGDVPMTIYEMAKAGIDEKYINDFWTHMKDAGHTPAFPVIYNYAGGVDVFRDTLKYILSQPECWAAALQDVGMLEWEKEEVTYKPGDRFLWRGYERVLIEFNAPGTSGRCATFYEASVGWSSQKSIFIKDSGKITAAELNEIAGPGWSLIK